jgi:hypothetical protein
VPAPLSFFACCTPPALQITVKPDKKDPAAVKQWGEAKCKADEMEYKIWHMDNCLTKLKGCQIEASQQACSLHRWQHASATTCMHVMHARSRALSMRPAPRVGR